MSDQLPDSPEFSRDNEITKLLNYLEAKLYDISRELIEFRLSDWSQITYADVNWSRKKFESLLWTNFWFFLRSIVWRSREIVSYKDFCIYSPIILHNFKNYFSTGSLMKVIMYSSFLVWVTISEDFKRNSDELEKLFSNDYERLYDEKTLPLLYKLYLYLMNNAWLVRTNWDLFG